MNKRRKSVGHAFSEHVYKTKRNPYYQREDDKSSGFDMVKRLPLLLLGIVFVVFVLRLLTLQVVRGEYYNRLSDENRTRTTLIPSPRGIIFDRNGVALVRNTPSFTKTEGDSIEWLSSDEALERISRGEHIISTPQREYLYKDMFAHVLGYVGKLSQEEVLQPEYADYGYSDFTGRMGLEQQYERLLHGINGRQLIEMDAQGNYVRTLGEDPPIPGKNLTTTLDLEIQKAVYKSMIDIESGAVVVSDPRDGSIRALYSKPSFDPNLFTKGGNYEPDGGYLNVSDIISDTDLKPVLNRAISGVYPPGSTFKIVTSTAALEESAITASTQIEDTGTRTVGGTTFGTWYFLQYGRKEGALNVVGALRRSNDIFFYVASEKIGATKLGEWAREFGFGRPLDIDIPGEAAGTVPGPSWKERVIGEDWYLGDTYNMSIGQGFLQTTPLQVNAMTNVAANGGTLFRPHLLPESKKVLQKDFISQENINLVRQGMLEACRTGGTGYPFFNFTVRNNNLEIDGVDFTEGVASGSAKTDKNKDEKAVSVAVGCKTGTSETYDHADPHAWFTIFAPFHNPEISVTILVEHAGEGSEVAAPIAKEILTDYFEKR